MAIDAAIVILWAVGSWSQGGGHTLPLTKYQGFEEV